MVVVVVEVEILQHIINPPISSQQLVETPNVAAQFASSIVEFYTPLPPLTLTLSDSVSSSDTTVKEDEKILTDSVNMVDSVNQAKAVPLADSMTVTDSTPGSFTIQSDHLVPVTIPIIEKLVNQLVPATVKTYFKIVE